MFQGPGILYIKEFSDLLQLLSHPDLVDEPNEVIGKVENLWGIVRIEDKQDSNHNLKRQDHKTLGKWKIEGPKILQSDHDNLGS